MEPFSAGTGETLSDMTERCLSINQKLEKDIQLSNLTAKYKSPRSGLQISGSEIPTKQIGDGGGVSSKLVMQSSSSPQSKPGLSVRVNSNVISSDDDSSDSDMPGLSLAALVAKHKISKTNVNENTDTNHSTVQRKKEEFHSDSSSDSEGVSLFTLASKYQSTRQSGSSPNATGISITSTEFTTLKFPKDSKTELHLKDVSKNAPQLSSVRDNRLCHLDTNQPNEKAIPKFVAAKFASDSDSDEPMSLADLIGKQKGTTKIAEPLTNSDLRPRELTAVASSNRYHTKSESDSFSPASNSLSSSLKRSLENETSTSLGSLKGAIEGGKDFQFSLGCTIPNSFKSKHIVCGLTSSLRSLKMEGPHTLTKSSYSDPDVSTKTTERMTSIQKPLFDKVEYCPFQDEKSPDDMDIGFGGINLSSAIKTPSFFKSSDDAILQANVDVMDEPEEVPIMTLLDHLSVDEEMNEDVTENCKDVKEEECSYDISNILKEKVKLQTRKCSSFGKVVCRQWKPRKIPYIRKEKTQTTVIPFEFLTLSPDDEIASFLKKT